MYMDIIGIYLFDQTVGMACAIGIDFLGRNAVKCGKVAICFKPFGFLFESVEVMIPKQVPPYRSIFYSHVHKMCQ